MEMGKTYKEIKDYLSKPIDKIDLSESFSLAKRCSMLLDNSETELLGRELIIRTLDLWGKISRDTYNVWNDLVEAAGLHPYVESKRLTGAATIRKEYFQSKNLKNVCFHEEQMKISLLLDAQKSLIVSAPTSFGKSLLIEEVVASKKYNNIVIIQPTLALLDETRKKLQKYSGIYNIIVSTTQKYGKGKNIFLFTGERVVEYEEYPGIDFFIIDEFYKLSMARDDERAAVLNHALYRLLKMTNNFYMLGPGIKSVSGEFVKKYNATFYRTNFSTVAVDVADVTKGKIRKDEREPLLFSLLESLHDPTLIYCSSPDKASDLVTKLLNAMVTKNGQINNGGLQPNNELIQWIDENIHKRWNLRDALAHSIGFHHGSLPRHIASSIVDAFNKGDIKYLFCTSTLIEGVNTSAKNVVLFDKKKGPKAIDYFDFSNIIGRSGRMNKHYIGKVFQFHQEPEQIELDIDVPLFTQVDAPLELLVQIDSKDINDAAIKKLEGFNKLDEDVQALLRRNSGVPIEGQLKIINLIESDFDAYYPIISWATFPSYKQLAAVLDMAWKYLLKKGESKGGAYTPNQLAALTLIYSEERSLRGLIEHEYNSDYWVNNFPQEEFRRQKIIHMVLQIAKHWFDYKLPKFLSVMSEIQSYICEKKGKKPGDYYYFSNQIEHNFLPADLSVLLEYDVPSSALKKLQPLINKNLPFDLMLKEIKALDLGKAGLISYEISKLKALPY